MNKSSNPNNPSNAFSIEDIYNFLSNPSIDLRSQVLNINFLEQEFVTIDDIFKNNYSIILFIPNPNYDDTNDIDNPNNIGHFTLFSNLDDKTVEFFDSFGQQPPDIIKVICKKFNLNLITNKIQLQNNSSYICAKFCLSRLYSLPTSLSDYVKILTSSKYEPDVIINKLYVNKYDRSNQ